ncbi:GW dipeptide domain-containing protein [Jeotgalicoccus huakuii]|nr:GW dipeptide domain-containing protein [Jeotgalicoccus huakuii]
MDISINTVYEEDFKINQTKLYFCNELNTKLIYESMHTLKVTGIASSINGKIIEVISRRIKEKKDYFKIKIGDDVIGWIALTNSPRIYRIPKITGKVIEGNIETYNNFGYRIREFINKLLEARYYFEEENKKYFLINRVGHRDLNIPVLSRDFYKYIVPKIETYIDIGKGEKLYKSSTNKEVIGEIESDNKVEVVGYYEKLEEVKIKYNSKSFWIKKDVNFLHYNDSFAITSLELIDQIMYLKTNSYIQKMKLDSQEKRIQKIKENVAITNDLQQLYLTRYLGDQNDTE